MASSSKYHNSFVQRFYRSLGWFSPNILVPHGLSGSISLCLGLFFIIQTLVFGPNHPLGYDIHGPRPRLLFLAFVLASALNAVGGILIINKSPKKYRSSFVLVAVTQLSLVWFAYRLSTQATREYNAWCSSIDKVAASSFILFLIGVPYLSFSTVPVATAAMVTISSWCLCLVFFYPFQLALFGNEWFGCVMDNWPYMIPGFTNYTYIPSVFSLAATMFLATLSIRKIVAPGMFQFIFMALVLVTLVLCVLLIDVHLPEVSTLKMLVLCPDDSPGKDDLAHQLEDMLDVARVVSPILEILNIKRNPPPEI